MIDIERIAEAKVKLEAARLGDAPYRDETTP